MDEREKEKGKVFLKFRTFSLFPFNFFSLVRPRQALRFAI